MKKLVLVALCGVLIFFALPVHAKEQTLTVMRQVPRGDARYVHAVEKLQEKYPGVQVVADDLGEALSPSSPEVWTGIDVIMTQTPRLGQHKQKDQLASLSDYTEQTGYPIETLPKGVLCAIDGQAVAVVETLGIYQCEVLDPELFSQLELRRPEDGWTWLDLFAIGEQLYAYNAQHGTVHKLLSEEILYPYWQRQYTVNEAAAIGTPFFDTPIFRTMLERWKELSDQSLIYIKGLDEPMEAGASILFGIHETGFSTLGERDFLPMPIYREGIRPVLSTFLCAAVPASAPNQQMALDFLLFYSEEEAIRKSSRRFVSGILPLEMSYEDIKTEWNLLSRVPSKENANRWKELAEQAIPWQSPPFSADSNGYRSYLNGEINLDVYIQALEEGVKGYLKQ